MVLDYLLWRIENGSAFSADYTGTTLFASSLTSLLKQTYFIATARQVTGNKTAGGA